MPVKTKTKKSAAKHHGGLTMIPLRSWVAFWFFILVTMTLVIVCFTNVFRSIDRDADRETAAAFQTIRQNLETQVAELQGRLANDATSEQSTSVTACETLGAGPADSHVYYVDPQTSVSVLLPFSLKWSGPACPLTPVVLDQDNIRFGPNVGGEGGFSRDSSMNIASSTDPDTVLRQLRATESTVTSIRQRTISGITVLSYTQGELGSTNKWEAFGKTFHYTISSQIWLTDEEAIKIIQSLRVTE